MNPSTYIPIIILWIIIFIMFRSRKAVVARKIIKNRKMEDKTEMIELAKKFIDKECLIYAFDSNHQFQGVIWSSRRYYFPRAYFLLHAENYRGT